jgi:hypothetical protein
VNRDDREIQWAYKKAAQRHGVASVSSSIELPTDGSFFPRCAGTHARADFIDVLFRASPHA